MTSLFAGTFSHALTLDEATFAAERYAPEIAASQANETAANASRIAAGRLPDPQLTVSLDSIPLEGSDRYRLNRSSRSISIMQDFPHSAKREAERQMADAAIQASISQSEFTRLNTRREATLAWIELYYFDQKNSVLSKQEEENRLRQISTRASLAGGGSAEDALMAQIEQKELADARDELNRQIRSAQARLARWVGPELASQKLNGDLPEWLNKEHGFNDIANQ
ncbi:MAG: TolC family protein, partial [Saezia sp.]